MISYHIEWMAKLATQGYHALAYSPGESGADIVEPCACCDERIYGYGLFFHLEKSEYFCAECSTMLSALDPCHRNRLRAFLRSKLDTHNQRRNP